MIKNKVFIEYYKLVNKKYINLLILGLIIYALPSFIIIIYPYLLREFINILTETKNIDYKIIFYFIGIFSSIIFFNYTGKLIISYYKLKSSLDLRIKIFKTFMHFSESEISKKGEAYYSRIINEDVAFSFNLFNENIMTNIFLIIRILPVLFIVYTINNSAFIIFCLTLFISFLIYYLNQKILPLKHKKIFETLGEILSFITESLNAVEIIKRYKYLNNRIKQYMKKSVDLNKRYFNTFFISANIDNFLSKLPLYTLRILLVLVLSNDYLKKRISIGDFIGILTYYTYMEHPTSYISFISNMLSQIKGNISRIVGYFNEANKRIKSKKILNNEIYQETKKDFFFKLSNVNISFDKKPILSNFSLTFPVNQIVGIVGLSGAGKSTLINSLLNINENYSGDIYFLNNNINLKNYDNTLTLNYYPQKSIVLNSSLKDNIVMGNKFCKDFYEKILYKLELSGFSDKRFGYNGNFISGGEKQKITFARFLYNFLETDGFVIDEPFVSLDEITKQKYLKILKEFIKGKFGIIISHDFYILLKTVDKIVFIESPYKYYYDKHQTLLDKSENYKKLFLTFKNKYK